MHPRWKAHWHAHHRFGISLLAALIAWGLSPAHYSMMTRVLFAGNVGGVVLLALAGYLVVSSDADDTQCQAAAHDPGRTIVWLAVLGTSAFSLFAAAFVLHGARTLTSPTEHHILTVLGVTTAFLAWFLTHLAFTLRYAHLYYRGRPEDEGGMLFPGPEGKPTRPSNFDFAYFGFTLGMCFQVSDVQITDSLIRRTVLGHALLSFAYNTGILAIVLNVVVGQLI